jgi:hypothetical protein
LVQILLLEECLADGHRTLRIIYFYNNQTFRLKMHVLAVVKVNIKGGGDVRGTSVGSLCVRMCLSVYVCLCAPNLCLYEFMCMGVYSCTYVHV